MAYPPPRPVTARDVYFVLWILVIAGASIALGLRQPGPGADALVGMCAGLLAVAAALPVHELGHALAAWLVGWRVHIVSVIGYAWVARERRVLTGVRRAGGWGRTFVVATPPRPDWLPRQHAVFVAGGPGANLLAAGGAWALSGALHSPVLPGAVAVFGLGQAFVGLLSLIPRRRGQIRSDGLHLWQIARGARDLPALRLGWVQQSVRSESELRNLDDALIEVLEHDAATLPENALRDQVLAARAILDHRYGDAMAPLGRVVARVPRHSQAVMLCLFRGLAGDVDGASCLLPMDASADDWAWLRARAVIAARRGDGDEARTLAEAWARANPDIGDDDDRRVYHAILNGDGLPRLEELRKPQES